MPPSPFLPLPFRRHLSAVTPNFRYLSAVTLSAATFPPSSFRRYLSAAIISAMHSYPFRRRFCCRHRVHTEWQWPLFGTHSIMMVKSAQPGEGGSARPPPFALSTIMTKVVVYAPAERTDTLCLFLLYPYRYSVVAVANLPSTFVFIDPLCKSLPVYYSVFYFSSYSSLKARSLTHAWLHTFTYILHS